ncbi:MAG TPA: ergothioneine biosynthesis protein EgtC [Micromonosporaceae bacterium]|nr:ergothioneine biosynthesis protein EgtC [Micromonosporaceae bacterium]
MCRHLLYLGTPVTLAALLLEPPHSLLHQSWAPRDMRGGGTINADGFGAGWYKENSPIRYRRDVPMWSDENFLSLAKVTSSGTVLAAVRSATIGMTFGEAAAAPFTADGWLFSHNGKVAGWPGSVAKLAERLPVTDLLTLDAPTDSALLWALIRHRLRGGEPPGSALATTVADVIAAAPGSRLNLLLTNGITGYATTAGHSLSVLNQPERVIVASEPFDEAPQWIAVPDHHLLTASPSGYHMEDM